MWRSLWQTPAALTLISTCVPDGCGVASSNSFSGALKSATLKLFIGVLPAYFLLSRHHATGGRTRQTWTCLEPFPFRWNRNGALDSCIDAFSLGEPVSTSLENALVDTGG